MFEKLLQWRRSRSTSNLNKKKKNRSKEDLLEYRGPIQTAQPHIEQHVGFHDDPQFVRGAPARLSGGRARSQRSSQKDPLRRHSMADPSRDGARDPWAQTELYVREPWQQQQQQQHYQRPWQASSSTQNGYYQQQQGYQQHVYSTQPKQVLLPMENTRTDFMTAVQQYHTQRSTRIPAPPAVSGQPRQGTHDSLGNAAPRMRSSVASSQIVSCSPSHTQHSTSGFSSGPASTKHSLESVRTEARSIEPNDPVVDVVRPEPEPLLQRRSLSFRLPKQDRTSSSLRRANSLRHRKDLAQSEENVRSASPARLRELQPTRGSSKSAEMLRSRSGSVYGTESTENMLDIAVDHLSSMSELNKANSLKPPAPATDALLSRMKELQLQPTQQHQRVGSPQQQVAPVVTSKVKGKENIGSGRSRDHVTVVTDNNNGETYTRGRLLGKGGFAKCYEFNDIRKNKQYACKVIGKNRIAKPHQKEKILREVELHRSLKHKHVVAFCNYIEDADNVYIVLELCSRKSLVHVLRQRRTVTEPEVRYYLKQLVDGTRYIHAQHIVHRDLKLGNMLLNNNMLVKIADFGLAAKIEFDGEKKMTVCGTPNYIAPEVLQKKGHSYEADIWAMGCIMYALLVGRPPFETTTLKETYIRITSNKFSVPQHVMPPAKALIQNFLRHDPSLRPSLENVLNDDFFHSGYMPLTLNPSCCDTNPKFTKSQLDYTLADRASGRPEPEIQEDTKHITRRSHSNEAHHEKRSQQRSQDRLPVQRHPQGQIQSLPKSERKNSLDQPTPTGSDRLKTNHKEHSNREHTHHVTRQPAPVRKEYTAEFDTQNGREETSAAQPQYIVPKPVPRERRKTDQVILKDVDKKVNNYLVTNDHVINKKQRHSDNERAIKSDIESRIIESTVAVEALSIEQHTHGRRYGNQSENPGYTFESHSSPRKEPTDNRYHQNTYSPTQHAHGDLGLHSPRSPRMNDELRMPSHHNGGQFNQQNFSATVAASPVALFQAIESSLREQDTNAPSIYIEGGLVDVTWVTKWVDYSNKYGFGFQLSDGSVGVLFNDTTRMLLSVSRRTAYFNDLSNRVVDFKVEMPPHDLRKKVTLLLYFSQYMDEHLIHGGNVIAETGSPGREHAQGLFMKKWFRTSKAIVMYLNNGTLQVNFFDDHTKVVLSHDDVGFIVTYINRQRQCSSYRLSQWRRADVMFGLNTDRDIRDRLKYARNMLENIINLEGEAV